MSSPVVPCGYCSRCGYGGTPGVGSDACLSPVPAPRRPRRLTPRRGQPGDVLAPDGSPLGFILRHGPGDWEAFATDGTFLECHGSQAAAVAAVREAAPAPPAPPSELWALVSTATGAVVGTATAPAPDGPEWRYVRYELAPAAPARELPPPAGLALGSDPIGPVAR